MLTAHPSGDAFDVVTIGRSSVDIYPLQTGVGIEDVETFGKFLGGSPTNVAVAASRLGSRARVVTAVGADPFGSFVRRELTRLGVDVAGILTLPGVATSVAFCELFPPDDFPLYFYRATPSPELRLRVEDLDLQAIEQARILWVTATGLSLEPSLAAHQAALDARAGATTILDLDYRACFWDRPEDAAAAVQAVLPQVSVAVGNLQECEVAVGESDPERAASALLESGVEIAIVKQGPRGVLALTADERVEVAATPCVVVNGLGAGDAFGGALCHGLLSGWDLHRTITFASAAGAIVASRLECSTAMPSRGEIDRVLALGHVPEGM
ncbi:5-dehydro-2-deoxygluconokinase [Sanguibacter gelidistatuariae]|uniref:5-dehydro-2-deoxygluconokinase n=2 Tax=Sanguibacter gelidistatuariae TaxID=1814289 RepID=A0A1G6HPP6_9MICO|nr:5-dehydro-2-deoxygluconokinase [Sanguibacter gelidistatuariae]